MFYVPKYINDKVHITDTSDGTTEVYTLENVIEIGKKVRINGVAGTTVIPVRTPSDSIKVFKSCGNKSDLLDILYEMTLNCEFKFVFSSRKPDGLSIIKHVKLDIVRVSPYVYKTCIISTIRQYYEYNAEGVLTQLHRYYSDMKLDSIQVQF